MAKHLHPELVVTPNPLPVGQHVIVSGAGFPPSGNVLLDFGHGDIEVDGPSFAYKYPYDYAAPGPAEVRAYVQSHKHWVRVASATFVVMA